MILNRELVPFFVLGFLLTSYMNVPVLGVSLIAIIIAIEKLGLLDKLQPVTAVEGDDDDDF